ncbi:uncharacterized protein EV422DRAFT_82934 [Fimicolochytrium jonesii]|uniref:uncharacterized protein n=1 Tax=Fimicolochytrium jonesii TaxID=1396493 RepID=UPI0022FF2D3B|nr:uncharacterized protein EV422DRAFT_82934 [Fimicolochytrium jonesii]KAI8820206.1 hypothetical protein EV422DRAFT_82934 [Fimicolochytrium jonesii]
MRIQSRSAMAPTTSHLPMAAPSSLPPKVAGQVTFYLHVAFSQLSWTYSAAPAGGKGPASVLLLWWGEEGAGTLFTPSITGAVEQPTAQTSTKPRPTAASLLPVPLRRASTWSSAPTSEFPAGKGLGKPGTSINIPGTQKITRRQYPIRCRKSQLDAYFRDMGPLTLQVLVNSTVCGEVTVDNLRKLTAEPSDSISGLYPILEAVPANGRSSIRGKSGKRKKLGEVHISMHLKPPGTGILGAVPPGKASKPKMKNVAEISDPKAGKNDALGSPVGAGIARADPRTGRQPEEKRQKQSEVTESRPIPASPRAPESEHRRHTNKNAEEASTTASHASHSASASEGGADASDLAARDKAGEQPSYVGASESEQNEQSCSAGYDTKEDIDVHLAATMREIQELAGDFQASRDLGNLSSSPESNSDILGDDILIEALNSEAGKTLIGQGKVRHPSGYDNYVASDDGSEDERTDGGRDGDDDEDDDGAQSYEDRDDLSIDERKRRAILPRYPTRAQVDTEAKPGNRKLSMERLTSLGRVTSICITAHNLELQPESVPHSATGLFLDITIPWGPGRGTERITMPSKSLPRLTASRNASRRPVGAPPENSKWIAAFEREQVFPCTFDASLVKSWVGNDIEFQITANQIPVSKLGSRTTLAARQRTAAQPSWSIGGTLPCRNVLFNEGLILKGKVPLSSKRGGPRNAERQSNIGELHVTVELQYAAPSSVTEQSSTHPWTAPPLNAPTEERKAKASDLRSGTEPFRAPPVPHYLYLNISTARALSIMPTLNASTVQLFLIVRFFSSSSPPIETAPISYKPPFDLQTGKLNPPSEFGFHYTVPLAITEQFVRTHSETPLIAEVWMVDAESAVTAPTLPTTKERGNSTLVDRGAKLLGLVKLPFSQVLKTLVEAYRYPAASYEELPVMVPNAEYAILDPFSGNAKGWVTASLALGTWGQVKKIRPPDHKPAEADRETERGKSAEASGRDEKTKRRHVNRHHEGDQAVGSRKAPRERRKSKEGGSDCQMLITIHRACGLRGLISALLRHRTNTHQSSSERDQYTPLHFAEEVGVNAFVRLQMFSQRISHVRQSSISSETAQEDFTEDDVCVETPIIAHTYTPDWEFSAELTVRGLDDDLIRWMRQGGEARGEIWHKVPRDEGDATFSEDVLLGTFGVPLRECLLKSHGVDKAWLTVVGHDDAEAAIRVSARFAPGFDLPLGLGQGYILRAGEHWWCQMQITARRVKVATQRPKAAGTHLTNPSPFAVEDMHIYVRWHRVRQPVSDVDVSEEFTTESSRPVPARRSYGDQTLVADLDYSFEEEFEITSSVYKAMAEERLAFEIMQRGSEGKDDTLLGTAYVDLSELYGRMRITHSKGKGSPSRRQHQKSSIIDGTFQVIHPSVPDLLGSSIELRIGLTRSEEPLKGTNAKPDVEASEELQTKDLPVRTIPTVTIPIVPTLPPEISVPPIPIDVIVEKAMQLPLMADPVCTYLPSPFVPQDQQQLAPPNTFVTFNWAGTPDTDVRTPVVPAQRSPTWNFTATVAQERTEAALRQLKAEKSITFQVWHAPSYGIGRKPAPDLIATNVVSDDQRTELLGSAVVELGGLFGGFKEIHGWYHVLDDRKLSKGQLLIRVRPAENVAAILREMTGALEYKGHGSKGSSCGRRTLEDACADMPAVAIAVPSNRREETLSSSIQSLVTATSTSKMALQAGQIFDTWVWTGSKWAHRQLDVRTVEDETSTFPAGKLDAVIWTPNDAEQENPGSQNFRGTATLGGPEEGLDTRPSPEKTTTGTGLRSRTGVRTPPPAIASNGAGLPSPRATTSHDRPASLILTARTAPVSNKAIEDSPSSSPLSSDGLYQREEPDDSKRGHSNDRPTIFGASPSQSEAREGTCLADDDEAGELRVSHLRSPNEQGPIRHESTAVEKTSRSTVISKTASLSAQHAEVSQTNTDDVQAGIAEKPDAHLHMEHFHLGASLPEAGVLQNKAIEQINDEELSPEARKGTIAPVTQMTNGGESCSIDPSRLAGMDLHDHVGDFRVR